MKKIILLFALCVVSVIVKSSPSIVLTINEVDVDNPGVDSLEFVELYSEGIADVSLDGYTLVFYNGSDDKVYKSIDLTGYSTSENGFFVVGSEFVELVDLVAFTKNGIQNGPDAVALYKMSVNSFPKGTGVVLDSLVDVLVYGTSDDNDDDLLVLTPNQPQVDENENGNSELYSMSRLNDSIDPLNSTSFVLREPTPGRSNKDVLTFVENEDRLKLIYPNPCQNFLVIDFAEKPLFFDLLGNSMKIFALTDGSYDVSGLTPGAYFVKVGTEVFSFIKK